MKTANVLSFAHDDYIFYFTQEAIKNKNPIIGFYFDWYGTPREIARKSVYGDIILLKANKKGAKG